MPNAVLHTLQACVRRLCIVLELAGSTEPYVYMVVPCGVVQLENMRWAV